MLCFPNAKINLGLHVTEKRPDGLHNLETIYYPLPLHDALEAVIARETTFRQTGLTLNTLPEDNLVMKASRLLAHHHPSLPPLEIHLMKAIPSEAGLGGGSSDAAFALKLLNDLCSLQQSDGRLEELASTLGADCPFFIRNTPVIATGTGNIFRPLRLACLTDYRICIVRPPVSVATKEAYALIRPQKPAFALEDLPAIPVPEWRNVLVNDFEPVVCNKHPIIGEIKDRLYALGADYAAMSGSGSALFGLFPADEMLPSADTFPPQSFVWKGRCSSSSR
jgi:4-diphosphocytidyl-2-C-methyl-D-erythritol kinase